MVFKDGRTVGGADTLDLDEVLDGDRKSGKETTAGRLAGHKISCGGAGAVETKRGKCIHLLVDSSYACLECIEQIERAHFVTAQEMNHLRG